MSWLTQSFSGSIGRKLIMALSGMFLIVFLIEHLLGNMMLLESTGTDFNGYAEFMKNNPIVRVMEYVLFGGFIIHILFSAIITSQNRMARPVRYAVNQPSANSSWFSRNMGLTGSILFVFLVVHLNTFFIPAKITHTATATLYDLAHGAFANPLYTGFYVLAMALLSFHLNHGFASSFQTLGMRHPKYTPFIKVVGRLFSIGVPALFAFIPVYIYFTQQ